MSDVYRVPNHDHSALLTPPPQQLPAMTTNDRSNTDVLEVSTIKYCSN